jgi:CHAD domain-containing protein
VRQHAPEGLNSEAQNVLAAVVAYHQRKLKKKKFARLDLSPQQEREALTIAALLRIAVGLNDSGSNMTAIHHVEPNRREMYIVVAGPKASSDAAVAQHKARLWTKIGYPEVKVMETDEAIKVIPFPEPKREIQIEPSDSLAEAGREVMRYHFAQMLRNEADTRLGEDIEALHDMRVATRRLRAAFEVFGDAFEPGALKSHLKGVRSTGRALGSVRDLDVFMEKAHHYLNSLPEEGQNGLAPLMDAWNQQREKARDKMLTYLDSKKYHDFKHNFNIFLRTPGAGARKLSKDQPTPHQVRELAPVLIYDRLAVVRAYDGFIEDAPVERLHALRIDFKKLRYTVEYFRQVLGTEANEIIDELKKLQDHLGDLNDAQVASQILQEFFDSQEAKQKDLSPEERQDLQPVVNYLEARLSEREHLITTFPEAWEHFKRPEFKRNLALAISAL